MRFEKRALADLKPAEYNPRKPLTPEDKEYQDIRRSIEEFGYSDPIVINFDGTIIKGHQRRTVMMDLGYTEAEVIVLDIQDKSKEKALNIALNKITGKWDDKLLKDILSELDLDGYDFSVTGFQREDLEDLIQLTEIPPEARDDDFDADADAEAIQVPDSKPGDIWQLGRHRLMCGDATDPEDVARLMGGVKCDLIITDPPYNVSYTEKAAKLDRWNEMQTDRAVSDITGDTLSPGKFSDFILSAFRNTYEVMRPGAAIYVYHADVNGLIFRRCFQEAGFKMSQTLIWEKNMFVLGRNDYKWRHEPILYGWKPGATHYFIRDFSQDTLFPEPEVDLKTLKKQELLSLLEQILREYRDLTTIQPEKNTKRNSLHPTMKPVPQVGRFMTNSSRPGDIVGDLFSGSGTLIIAAEQLGRNAYCMEIDPRYVDVIIHRWEHETGQKAVLLNE